MGAAVHRQPEMAVLLVHSGEERLAVGIGEVDAERVALRHVLRLERLSTVRRLEDAGHVVNAALPEHARVVRIENDARRAVVDRLRTLAGAERLPAGAPVARGVETGE